WPCLIFLSTTLVSATMSVANLCLPDRVVGKPLARVQDFARFVRPRPGSLRLGQPDPHGSELRRRGLQYGQFRIPDVQQRPGDQIADGRQPPIGENAVDRGPVTAG